MHLSVTCWWSGPAVCRWGFLGTRSLFGRTRSEKQYGIHDFKLGGLLRTAPFFHRLANVIRIKQSLRNRRRKTFSPAVALSGIPAWATVGEVYGSRKGTMWEVEG